MPFINEAVYALRDGVAEPEAIDTVAKLGFGHPIGPLALADLIGLDTCVAIMGVLHRGLGDDEVRAVPAARRARRGRSPRTEVRARVLRVRVSRLGRGAASSAARSLSARRAAEKTSSPSEYARGEVGGAVHLEHRPAAVRRRQQVDADEVAAERLGRRERERSASGGGTTGTRRAPSATFVRHSPGRACRETAPTTHPPATSSRRS